MTILFTICGRAGSKGIKNKNLKHLCKIPLSYYTLASISLFRDNHPEHEVLIAVNSDSNELIEQISKNPFDFPVKRVCRKEEHAGDTSPKVSVIQDTFITINETHNIDVVVDLDITSPLRRVCDIENAILQLINGNNLDVVYSVVPSRRSPYFNMVEDKGEGVFNKICESNYTARQQAPITYELNASIYAYSPVFLDTTIEKTLLEYRGGIIEMKDYLVLDIDKEEDFELMEVLVPIFYEKDEGIRQLVDYMRARI